MSRLPVALFVTGTLALVGCGVDDDPIYVDDEVTTPTPEPVVVPLTTQLPTTAPASSEVVFDQLWSPANAVVEVVGSGATATDTATVDDVVAAFTSFETTADGGFVARLAVPDEGAHSVCVAGTCGRVYTLAAGAESLDEVAVKIDEAKVQAALRFDYATEFPEWSLETAGPFSGTGGSTDDATKTVTIYSNRDRTVEEFTRTILHEFGHVLDFERMTDAERDEYLALRGIAPAIPWRSDGSHSIEAWALQPSEDFAEVVAMLLSDGEYIPRTASLAAPPTADQLAAVADLIDL